MVRTILRHADSSIETDVPADRIQSALQEPGMTMWIDLLNESDAVSEQILRDVFRFHPLAVEDAIKQVHVPKIDDWGGYLYIVLHSVGFTVNDSSRLCTRELDIFLGPNYLVTHREEEMDCVERTWTSCLRDPRAVSAGSAGLLYHLIDELVAGHMPVADAIDEALEATEERIIDKPVPAVLPEVLGLKRALLHLRRIIAPQRDVLGKLARDEYAVVAAAARPYFRDVYDHLVRLNDIVESMRDLAAGVLETYLSSINNRMNEVMKTLTLITTFFMPISFITGFFGMNFFAPEASPEGWTGKIAFIAVIAVITALPGLLWLWLKWRKRA
jgi:magnesium transporter